jgi:hypothetical protein
MLVARQRRSGGEPASLAAFGQADAAEHLPPLARAPGLLHEGAPGLLSLAG